MPTLHIISTPQFHAFYYLLSFITPGKVKSLSIDRDVFTQAIESLITNSFNFHRPQF